LGTRQEFVIHVVMNAVACITCDGESIKDIRSRKEFSQ